MLKKLKQVYHNFRYHRNVKVDSIRLSHLQFLANIALVMLNRAENKKALIDRYDVDMLATGKYVVITEPTATGFYCYLVDTAERYSGNA